MSLICEVWTKMAEQFSLDLLGQHILAMRGDIATIKTDVAVIKDRLNQHQDELSVVSRLGMKATGERIARASLQAQLRSPGTDRGPGASGVIKAEVGTIGCAARPHRYVRSIGGTVVRRLTEADHGAKQEFYCAMKPLASPD